MTLWIAHFIKLRIDSTGCVCIDWWIYSWPRHCVVIHFIVKAVNFQIRRLTILILLNLCFKPNNAKQYRYFRSYKQWTERIFNRLFHCCCCFLCVAKSICHSNSLNRRSLNNFPTARTMISNTNIKHSHKTSERCEQLKNNNNNINILKNWIVMQSINSLDSFLLSLLFMNSFQFNFGHCFLVDCSNAAKLEESFHNAGKFNLIFLKIVRIHFIVGYLCSIREIMCNWLHCSRMWCVDTHNSVLHDICLRVH